MKLRLRFAKLGKVRFTSHRDVARMWERALRRVELRVVYSGGFAPRPKLSFGLALPTGAESVAEYLDVDLEDDHGSGIEVASLPPRLSAALPAGIDVLATAAVEPRTPSLQEAVTSCTWQLGVQGADRATLERLIGRMLAAEQLVVTRERKGKQVTDDLRPAIIALEAVSTSPHGTEIEAELGVHPRSLRPSELIDAIGAGLVLTRVRRTHQWIERDRARVEPLPVSPIGSRASGRGSATDGIPATSAPHAKARAS